MFLRIKFIFYYFIFLIISAVLIDVSNGQISNEVCSRRCLPNTNCVYPHSTSILLVCENNVNWYKGNSNSTISNENGPNDFNLHEIKKCPNPTATGLVIKSLASIDSGPGLYKAKEFDNDPTFKCTMNVFVYGNLNL